MKKLLFSLILIPALALGQPIQRNPYTTNTQAAADAHVATLTVATSAVTTALSPSAISAPVYVSNSVTPFNFNYTNVFIYDGTNTFAYAIHDAIVSGIASSRYITYTNSPTWSLSFSNNATSSKDSIGYLQSNAVNVATNFILKYVPLGTWSGITVSNWQNSPFENANGTTNYWFSMSTNSLATNTVNFFLLQSTNGSNDGSQLGGLNAVTNETVAIELFFKNHYYWNMAYVVNNGMPSPVWWEGPMSGFFDGSNYNVYISASYPGYVGARLWQGTTPSNLVYVQYILPPVTNDYNGVAQPFPYITPFISGILPMQNRTNWFLVNYCTNTVDNPGDIFIAYSPVGSTNSLIYVQSGGTNLPIIIAGAPGSWDAAGVYSGCWIVIGNQYRIYFDGVDSFGQEQIGYSWSTNRTGPYVEYAKNPVLQPLYAYEGNILQAPYLLNLGQTLIMCYSSQFGTHLSYASSIDGGNTWTRWWGNQVQTSVTGTLAQRPCWLVGPDTVYLMMDDPSGQTNYIGYSVNLPVGNGFGITTNIQFTDNNTLNPSTNTLYFTNGLLMDITQP